MTINSVQNPLLSPSLSPIHTHGRHFFEGEKREREIEKEEEKETLCVCDCDREISQIDVREERGEITLT